LPQVRDERNNDSAEDELFFCSRRRRHTSSVTRCMTLCSNILRIRIFVKADHCIALHCITRDFDRLVLTARPPHDEHAVASGTFSHAKCTSWVKLNGLIVIKEP